MSNEVENRDIAIKLSGVKKRYRLGQIGGGTLQGDLQSWWAKVRGKEDPNSKIGAGKRIAGQTFMALNGIDLTVYKGEALGIIGGNGAGKSTMLKLLSRVTAPTEGEIDIYGRITSMLEVGTGFNGEMTGRENVYLNGAILGMTKAEIDSKMEEIIEFSEVREFIDTPVKRYSSGMYVKLAFSVAAHLDSEIMIMDEVLAVGDMNFQQKCLKRMRDLANSGKTVLYVSHNMNTIRQLCDRCVVLSAGKIQFVGDVEQSIQYYSQESQYEIIPHVDLSTKARIDGIVSKIRMNAVDFTHNEGMILTQGSTLDVILTIDSDVDVPFVQLRFVIYHVSGQPVGMSYTQKMEPVKIGKNRFRIKFDTQYLPVCEYQVNLVLFDYENDIQIRQDVVEKAFYFKVVAPVQENYEPEWNFHGWGSVSFPEIEVEKIEEKPHG